jgi:hypothetical protein
MDWLQHGKFYISRNVEYFEKLDGIHELFEVVFRNYNNYK